MELIEDEDPADEQAQSKSAPKVGKEADETGNAGSGIKVESTQCTIYFGRKA